MGAASNSTSAPRPPSLDLLEASSCPQHAPRPADGDQPGWAERESGASLPLINVSLQTFAPNMRQVVKVITS